MPHTFNNSHSIRHSHNGAKPVNHKATRMHTKINLNKPQIYSDDSLKINPIIRIENDLKYDNNILQYLKDIKTLHPNELLFLDSNLEIYDINRYYDFGVKHIDDWIDQYTSYCIQLDDLIENLDMLEAYCIIGCDTTDLSHLQKRYKKSSHRISREKSLPKSRLERQIKKQIFFKKSRKMGKEIQEEVEEVDEPEKFDSDAEYDKEYLRYIDMIVRNYY